MLLMFGANRNNLVDIIFFSIYFAFLCAIDVWLLIAVVLPNVRTGKLIPPVLAVATYFGFVILCITRCDWSHLEPLVVFIFYMPLFALGCAIGAWFLPRGIGLAANRVFKLTGKR